MKTNKDTVGFRIKNIRKSLGLNQTDFAKKIGATLPAVSNWETGRNIPNNKRLLEIAELGSVSVDELLYGDKEDYILNLLTSDLEENKFLLHSILKIIGDYNNFATSKDDFSRKVYVNRAISYIYKRFPSFVKNTSIDQVYETTKEQLSNLFISFLENNHEQMPFSLIQNIKNYIVQYIDLANGWSTEGQNIKLNESVLEELINLLKQIYPITLENYQILQIYQWNVDYHLNLKDFIVNDINSLIKYLENRADFLDEYLDSPENDNNTFDMMADLSMESTWNREIIQKLRSLVQKR